MSESDRQASCSQRTIKSTLSLKKCLILADPYIASITQESHNCHTMPLPESWRFYTSDPCCTGTCVLKKKIPGTAHCWPQGQLHHGDFGGLWCVKCMFASGDTVETKESNKSSKQYGCIGPLFLTSNATRRSISYELAPRAVAGNTIHRSVFHPLI